MGTRLDDACRKYIKLRDQYTCQICGIRQDELPASNPYMHNSHMVSRKWYCVRWRQENLLCSCPKCHLQWGDGMVTRQIAAIERMWGAGTAQLMEDTARAYPSIKGTNLNSVDFRLSLEEYFLDLIEALESGTVSPAECKDTVWTDWGMPLK